MRFTAVFLSVLMAGAPALAEDMTTWGEVGDWAILVDPESGNGCLMQKTFDNGVLVQIGAVPNRQGGFFAAYNAEWTHIEDGVEGVVRMDFGDALFEGAVVGQFEGDLPGGYAFFDNPDFVSEFAKRQSLTLVGEQGGTFEIDLSGTTRGLEAVRKCQDEQPEG